MADDEMQDVSTPQTASSSSDDESDEEQVELLVTGRERRKTAGNRYNRDAAQEEAPEGADEDEVALLFADQDGLEDEEFKSDVSDEDDMSSSDDDDQGPNAGAEDLEGEQELQKLAKNERAKKRKADLALTTTAGLRKRPKIDPTAPKAAPKKPSKKKERVTWLPDPDNANARSSLRKQTIAHREHTLARLKESEAQSKKYRALKEKRDREKARDAPKAMTQADRLAEAERTERRNAKSLNRWEAMEKRRNEEQAAKLAALKSRKLEGAVISWRSSKEHFKGPKHPPAVTKMEFLIEEGPKKRGRKSKAYHEQLANIRESATHDTVIGIPPPAHSMPLQFQQQLPPMQQAVQQSPQTWLGPPPPPSGSPYPSAQLPSYQFPPPQAPQQSAQHYPTPRVDHPHPPPQPEKSPIPPQQVSPDNTNAEDPRSMRQATATADERNPDMSAAVEPPMQSTTDADAPEAAVKPDPAQQDPAKSTETDNSFLFGIHEYAMQTDASKSGPDDTSDPKPAETSMGSETTNIDKPDRLTVPQVPIEVEGHGTDSQVPNTVITNIPKEQPKVSQPVTQSIIRPHTPSGAYPPPSVTVPAPAEPSTFNGVANFPAKISQTDDNATVPPTPSSPEVPMEEGFMTKNLLILDDFDELSVTERNTYGVFFNTKRSAKPSKHSATLCPITMMPAKYRDPATGIGYANMYAYKVLQELKQHKFVWSSMLGCYIGRDGAPIARGCPEGFLAK